MISSIISLSVELAGGLALFALFGMLFQIIFSSFIGRR